MDCSVKQYSGKNTPFYIESELLYSPNLNSVGSKLGPLQIFWACSHGVNDAS